MRVLMLSYEYPPLGGGAANALSHLLDQYNGIDDLSVDLVTSTDARSASVEYLGVSVRLHKIPVAKKGRHYWANREMFEYFFKARRYAKTLVDSNGYDLCHAFFALPCGWIARGLGSHFPYVVSLRGSDVPGFNPRLDQWNALLRPAFRRVVTRAAAVLANSEGLRELALQSSPDVRIEVITNGVDCERFTPGPRKFGEPYRLVTVSRLIARKRLDDLIKALPEIKRRLGSVRLSVAGEGNLEASLKQLAADEGVADEIEWLGYVDRDALPAVYDRAHLFILPSVNEGMSNALLEAMASGLPVVVTETGGTRELVADNGLIIEAKDPDGIAGAVAGILHDESSWVGMGQSGRETALKFSWAQVAQDHINVYRRSLEPDPGPGREAGRRVRVG